MKKKKKKENKGKKRTRLEYNLLSVYTCAIMINTKYTGGIKFNLARDFVRRNKNRDLVSFSRRTPTHYGTILIYNDQTYDYYYITYYNARVSII